MRLVNNLVDYLFILKPLIKGKEIKAEEVLMIGNLGKQNFLHIQPCGNFYYEQSSLVLIARSKTQL